MNELEAIALLDRALARVQRGRGVVLAIGDDAAILRVGRERLVFTIDSSLEHVHFERAWVSLRDVAFRAVAAAVSDIAAMGASPVAALSALCLPRGISARELSALARGQAEASRAFGCPIVGGNIARGSALELTTSVLGRAKRPLRRDGARVGDELWLVGTVGLARAGLELLRRGAARIPRAAAMAWRRPVPLLAQGAALVGRAHACVDVSDGLAGDAAHLADASGVRVVIEELALARLLGPELAAAAQRLDTTALALALAGGEDYALLATGPASRRPRFARRIGRVERGHGVGVEDARGKLRRAPRGFDHLA